MLTWLEFPSEPRWVWQLQRPSRDRAMFLSAPRAPGGKYWTQWGEVLWLWGDWWPRWPPPVPWPPVRRTTLSGDARWRWLTDKYWLRFAVFLLSTPAKSDLVRHSQANTRPGPVWGRMSRTGVIVIISTQRMETRRKIAKRRRRRRRTVRRNGTGFSNGDSPCDCALVRGERWEVRVLTNTWQTQQTMPGGKSFPPMVTQYDSWFCSSI